MGYAGLDAVESGKLEQQNQNHVLFSYLYDINYLVFIVGQIICPSFY